MPLTIVRDAATFLAAIGPVLERNEVEHHLIPPSGMHSRPGTQLAQLSEALVCGGRRFCVLYTDLANPTSNRIYARIGYRPGSDWALYDLC